MTAGGDAGGPYDPPEQWVFYLLFQAARRRDASFSESLASLGLDLATWRVLWTIGRFDDCTMNELAEFTTVDRTTLTRTVDQLAAAGWLERRNSVEDRRRVYVAMTPKGEALFAQGLTALRDFNAGALEGIDAHEIEALRSVLARIIRNVCPSTDRAEAVIGFVRPPSRS